MPQTKTITIYDFDELSEDAKEVARNWWREGVMEYGWWYSIYEDFDAIASIMGFNITGKAFSGFCSQGDGAHFLGEYEYKARSVKAVKAYAPKDQTLHKIAQDLCDLQKPHFYGLSARITRNHYCRYDHEGAMSVYVELRGETASDAAESDLKDICRRLAQWLYSSLEREYEYQNADVQVDESIRMNDYQFTIDGKVV